MFYVYEWYIVKTGEIIYVGKGTRSRYKVRKHNKLFNTTILNFDCESRIIKYFENEKDAFEYEYNRINELKLVGQCKCNIRQGGFGGTATWWTDELRKKYSIQNVMKSEDQRQRMKENNPMKNVAVSKKVATQKSRAVIINNKRYASIKDASAELHTYYATIANWCKKGVNPDGQLCRFEDSEQVIFNGSRYNKTSCKPMTYLGIHYDSVIDCSKDIGVSQGTLTHWLQRGWDISGNECRFDDDTRNNPYENPFKGKRAVPVIVNGVRYNSVSDAAKALNLKKTTLAPYFTGRRKSTKYICTYDNQQPSRTNSNNSSTEGSTTNE